jgi:hypothetical protein
MEIVAVCEFWLAHKAVERTDDIGVVYGCSSPNGGCVELQIGECYSNPAGTYLACEFAFKLNFPLMSWLTSMIQPIARYLARHGSSWRMV